MIVLIPAYEPDERLVELVGSLNATDEVSEVVIVDDGSGAGYSEVFARTAELGARVHHLEQNKGKGAALKHGYAHILREHPNQVVVCADCDGQHTPADIAKVGAAALAASGSIVLGVRRFTGKVPFKSRLGNGLTKVLFSMSTGRGVSDTQTGLRAYHPSMLRWLSEVEGDRFEYELEVLLRAKEAGFDLLEVPIETIYLEGNKSTHFRPVVDSLRVYAPLVRFCMSSILAFVVDVIVLQAVYGATAHLAAAVVSARAVSASVNFATNRKFVFGGQNSSRRMSAVQYFSLAIAILFANYWSMHLLYYGVELPLLVAKLITELGLFAVSYQVQRRFIFRFSGARGRSADLRRSGDVGRSAAAIAVVLAAAQLVMPARAADGLATADTAQPVTVENAFVSTVPTNWTYSDDRVSIDIEKVVLGTGKQTITYFVARLVLSDATVLRGGSARASLGRGTAAPTSIAAANNALFAITGDYYGIRKNGLVIRNGEKVVARGVRKGLVLNRDGTGRVYDEKKTTVPKLLAAGAWHTMSFGPVLVQNGKASPEIGKAKEYLQRRHPRAGICIPARNELLFILVDGRRTGYSRGMTLPEFAQLFIDRGCVEAYNLDGGRSAAMIFRGELINKVPGGQRGISDIFYIANP